MVLPVEIRLLRRCVCLSVCFNIVCMLSLSICMLSYSVQNLWNSFAMDRRETNGKGLKLSVSLFVYLSVLLLSVSLFVYLYVE